MSQAEFNKEENEIPLTIEEQLEKARANRDPEEEAKRERDYEAYAHIFRELYDYDNEMRRRKRKEEQAKIKDELSRPISMPDIGEKSYYGKVREKTIRVRDRLDKILISKLYD